MSDNRLAAETSPYLLQHKDNPVHWRPWGPEALAEAARADRPVLLSVGYAACHWCHVMAHESFENPETAALMNRLFVNIKVDREERPDVDALYQAALALLGEHGGWPLTMFLKPSGEPFWGGTYFPSEARFGRPGFRDVLARVAEVYREAPDKVDANAKALREALDQMAQNQAAGDIPAGAVAQVAQQLCRAVDPFHGGLGNAPKFPNTGVFELLWRAYLRTGQAPFRQAVITTLDAMALGGIYDHLGGGFARYATDAHWLVPHFEKMLYDNAQLIDLLTLVWQDTGTPLYRARVEETVGWMLREMRAQAADDNDAAPRGFASTQDADSEGEEGKFYVWTSSEIDRLLGADAGAFKAAYDVTPIGNWEGKTILHRRQVPPDAERDAALEATLTACRAKLFAARAERIRPGWDDKVLADWNGLAIAALANAAAVFERPDWLAAAESAFAFVRDHMQRDGRLLHCWRAGKLQHPASIDDHANMARAALALHQATGTAAYLDRARDWVAAADAHYWDADGGGYFFSADDTEALIARSKTAYDSATPAGNGTMLGVLARLWLLTGEAAYGERARALARAFSGELQRNAMPLASLLNNAALLDSAVQVALVGPADAPAMAALRRAVRAAGEPDLVLNQVADGAALPAAHPAAGKGTVDGRPTAYVCRGPVCSLPLTDPAALQAALREGRPATEG